MASERAQFVVNMMRTRKRQAPDPTVPVDYAKRRSFVEEQHSQQKTAPGVQFAEFMVNGVEMVCCTPEGSTSENVILYIHGGGFVTGSAKSSKAYASWLAAAAGTKVYTVSYRLAPEHPFPAAPEDCLTAYRAVLACHPDRRIALVGGSAGGNLCLVTTLLAREQNLPRPAALGLFSAAACRTEPLPSRYLNRDRDCMLSQGINDEIRKVYSLDADEHDPHVSPIFADLTGFPPMYLVVDRDEVLLDDTLLLYAHARLAGVEAKIRVTEGLFHDFPSMGPELPEGKEVMEELVAFLRQAGI